MGVVSDVGGGGVEARDGIAGWDQEGVLGWVSPWGDISVGDVPGTVSDPERTFGDRVCP